MFKRLFTITLLTFAVALIGPAWSYDTAMAETVESDAGAPATVTPETPQPMTGRGMMHGGGRHGKGQGGMMHGGGQHGKRGHEKDSRVIQRLDMIEAHMAKIEAMLESLVQR